MAQLQIGKRMNTIQIEISQSVDEACNRFMADIKNWITHCISTYGNLPSSDVHDQGTFTTSWAPYIQASQDKAALAFIFALRDKIRDYYVNSGKWRHGYWTMQEAHHGTEHFELFLGTLLYLEPDDAETCSQLVDMAEHLGNWSDDVAPWFNWDTRLYKSIFFGSDGIRDEPGMSLNMPDHMRCANISLLTYEASGEDRYLNLATTYAEHWAEAMLADTPLPIGLTQDGPIYVFDDESQSIYRSFAGQAPALDAEVDRAENFLCSATAQTFMKLWKLTGRDHFRQAVEKLLDSLVKQIDDPDAGAAADAIRFYRAYTGDTRYDEAVGNIAKSENLWQVKTLSFKLADPRRSRASGIGKRGDMPLWLEDGTPRAHSPLTLALAAEISDDAQLAARAIDLARAYFALAREAFPDGRDHGCSARSVSAVARGHGRDNHAGMITAVLKPVMRAFL